MKIDGTHVNPEMQSFTALAELLDSASSDVIAKDLNSLGWDLMNGSLNENSLLKVTEDNMFYLKIIIDLMNKLPKGKYNPLLKTTTDLNQEIDEAEGIQSVAMLTKFIMIQDPQRMADNLMELAFDALLETIAEDAPIQVSYDEMYCLKTVIDFLRKLPTKYYWKLIGEQRS